MPNQSEKTLLCFGDSNTYGVVPITDFDDVRRHPPADRWPGVVARRLGESWRVEADGLPSRTTVHADPVEGAHLNGLRVLPASLASQAPLSVVAIMLGTNDLKNRFSVNASDIAQSAGRLVDAVHTSGAGPGGGAPRVLLIAPPPVKEVGPIGEVFVGARAKSESLGRTFRALAEQKGVDFLDAGTVAESSDRDGIHLEADSHHNLGEAVADKLSAMTL